MLKVNETFVSIQGEVNVGRLAFFIRLAECNLDCIHCSADYAKSEGANMSIDELVSQAQYFQRIVITGGEPLLQKEDVAKLITKLRKLNPHIVIEIETNATIKPKGITDYKNIIFNVSPKLKSSKNDYECRIKPDVIAWFNTMEANFKFVIDTLDDVDEVNMLVRDYGIKKSNVFLIPEGNSVDEQWQKMRRIVQYAKMNGYNFSPRLQILLWNNERGK